MICVELACVAITEGDETVSEVVNAPSIDLIQASISDP